MAYRKMNCGIAVNHDWHKRVVWPSFEVVNEAFRWDLAEILEKAKTAMILPQSAGALALGFGDASSLDVKISAS